MPCWVVVPTVTHALLGSFNDVRHGMSYWIVLAPKACVFGHDLDGSSAEEPGQSQCKHYGGEVLLCSTRVQSINNFVEYSDVTHGTLHAFSHWDSSVVSLFFVCGWYDRKKRCTLSDDKRNYKNNNNDNHNNNKLINTRVCVKVHNYNPNPSPINQCMGESLPPLGQSRVRQRVNHSSVEQGW